MCTFVFVTRQTGNGEGGAGSIFPSRIREILKYLFSVTNRVTKNIATFFDSNDSNR